MSSVLPASRIPFPSSCRASGAALLALSATCLAVAADGSVDGPVVLDAFVVVENRLELPLGEISPSTSFVAVEGRETPASPFLSDLLRSVPGMVVTASGGPGGPVSLFTRGAESNHTAVLLDGRRLNPGLAGGYDLGNIATESIGHVEILRGASSTLWGAEGIGGVVNIVSRDARALDRPELMLLGEGGANGTWRGSLAGLGRSGAWDGSFCASYLTTDNEVANGDYELRSARATAGYSVNDHLRFNLLALAAESEAGSPGARSYPTPDDRVTQTTWSVSPGWAFEGDGAISGRGFYSFNRQRQHFVSPPWSEDWTVFEQHEIDQQFAWRARDTVSVVTGFNWQRADIARDSFGLRNIDRHLTSLGLWAQTQVEPADGLRVLGGLRWDNHSAFENTLTGNLALHQRLAAGVSFHAKIATAYAPPTPQDLYYPGFSNPSLTAEESVSYEAGLRWLAEDGRAQVSVVAFRSDIDNFIQFVSRFEDGMFSGRPENVAEARTSGVEASGSMRLGEAVSLAAGYTWLDADNLSAGQRLVRRPRHLATAVVEVRPVDAVTLSLEGRWVRGREDVSSVTFAQVEMPDYFVARVAARWSLTPQLSVFARLENAFHEVYDEVDGYAALGRALHAGARVSF